MRKLILLVVIMLICLSNSQAVQFDYDADLVVFYPFTNGSIVDNVSQTYNLTPNNGGPSIVTGKHYYY